MSDRSPFVTDFIYDPATVERLVEVLNYRFTETVVRIGACVVAGVIKPADPNYLRGEFAVALEESVRKNQITGPFVLMVAGETAADRLCFEWTGSALVVSGLPA